MEESLRGKLLIASPVLEDPSFARSVILMTEHSDSGAMGIVLNQPAETAASELLPDLSEIAKDDPLFIGGPVQPQAVVLLAEFADPDAAAWIVVADVGLAAADTEFEQLGEAVRRGRFYAGYSGWAPGQLEAELELESWIIEAPMPSELFPDDPDALWQDVLKRMGGEYALISTMPEDPSVN